jgi:integrase
MHEPTRPEPRVVGSPKWMESYERTNSTRPAGVLPTACRQWAESELTLNTGVRKVRKGSQYGLTWDMVDWTGRMLNIPRAKNEETVHVPLNDAGMAALRVVRAQGDGRGACVSSAKTGQPLENGRHWFDGALFEAGIKDLRWHDLRHTFRAGCA